MNFKPLKIIKSNIQDKYKLQKLLLQIQSTQNNQNKKTKLKKNLKLL